MTLSAAETNKGPGRIVDGDDRLIVRPAAGPLTDRSGTITAGASAQTVAAANSARKYLLIQNVSPGDLWVNLGVTAVANQPSFKLAAGGAFVMEGSFVSTELVSIIGATTGQAFTAKEA